MKLMFLDFDGVFYTLGGSIYHRSLVGDKKTAKWEPDPVALSLLSHLLDEFPDMKVVVSSTWRLGNTIETLQEILGDKIGPKVIAVTPALPNRYRGEEIKLFLDNWNEFYRGGAVEDFIIIDDDRDMNPYMGHLIWTDSLNGFTTQNLLEAERYFKMKPISKFVMMAWKTIKYNLSRKMRSVMWRTQWRLQDWMEVVMDKLERKKTNE